MREIQQWQSYKDETYSVWTCPKDDRLDIILVREDTPATGKSGRMSVRRRGSGRENSDGELYFEMEFPAREEDNVSFSSRSIESFGSETGPDSRYADNL